MKYVELAQEGHIEESIVEFIREYVSVSFAELQRVLGKYFPTQGDFEIGASENVIYWTNVSEDFAGGIANLRRENRISLEPVHPILYMMDGMSLKLPLVQRPPKNGYRKPHWLPVCLRVQPAS